MDLKLPNLGEGADSGVVVNVFVKEGDPVAKDQAVIELENEKAVATIPATAAGKVTQVFVKAGDKVTGFDLVEASRSQAKADGAAIADSASAAVKGADIVITMLPAGKHVVSVWTEILPAVAKGASTPRATSHACATVSRPTALHSKPG